MPNETGSVNFNNLDAFFAQAEAESANSPWVSVPLQTPQQTQQVVIAKKAAALKAAPKKAAIKPLDARENFLFGCDPELFVFNTETGKFVTAEGLIPGTKADPYKVDKGAVQVDGMAAEFNINPARTFEEFDDNIATVMKQLEKMLPKGHVLRAIPAVVFDKESFDAAPDKAKMLGCSPDYNAWTGKVNPPPRDPSNPYLRTASGHIHIGWTEGADTMDPQHVSNCCDLVKQLDWYLGGWSCHIDSDPTRRALYGKAGALRFKDYGVEYRVLSNFWIVDRAKRLEVWNRLQIAIGNMVSNRTFMPEAARAYNEHLISSIDTTRLHPTLVSKYQNPLIELMI